MIVGKTEILRSILLIEELLARAVTGVTASFSPAEWCRCHFFPFITLGAPSEKASGALLITPDFSQTPFQFQRLSGSAGCKFMRHNILNLAQFQIATPPIFDTAQKWPASCSINVS